MNDLQAIHDFIYELIDARSENELYRASTSLMCQLVDADACDILAVDDGDIRVVVSSPERRIDRSTVVELTRDLVGGVETIDRSHIYADVTAVRSASAEAQSEPTVDTDEPRSVMLVPIESVGLLVATDPETGAFTEQDGLWAEQLAAFLEGIAEADLTFEGSSAERLGDVADVLSRSLASALSVARGSLDLAEESGDPEYFDRTRRALDRIEDLGVTMELLADQTAEGDPDDVVDLSTVVQSVAEDLAERGIEVELESTRSLRVVRPAFRQLLMTLFSDAIVDDGESGPVTVGAIPDGFFVETGGEVDTAGGKWRLVEHLVAAHGWAIDVRDDPAGGTRLELTGVDG